MKTYRYIEVFPLRPFQLFGNTEARRPQRQNAHRLRLFSAPLRFRKNHEESLSKDVGRKILEPCFRELFFAPHFSTASIVFDRECAIGEHSTLDVDSSQQAVLANFSPSRTVQQECDQPHRFPSGSPRSVPTCLLWLADSAGRTHQ
jgi:hypothetical protein